jgi:hypothetical protein
VVVVAGALGLAGCGSGEFTPPSDLPSWPAGASPSPAVSISPQAGTTEDFVAETDGWEFRPYVDIEVTALGYFDGGANGLVHDHKVGIFDADSHRSIVTAQVHPDSALQGAFRWESISPAVLHAGKSYVLAGTSLPPYDAEAAAPGQWAPELKRGAYREAHGGWQYPVEHFREPFTGPNFKFKPLSAVSLSP